jgi:hypothetical protein
MKEAEVEVRWRVPSPGKLGELHTPFALANPSHGAEKTLALPGGEPSIHRPMRSRIWLCLTLAATLSGCFFQPYKKQDTEDRKPLKNVAGDTNFQAFVGRLRIAVRKKDVPMIASMMTADFGYTWDESAQPSAQIFAYWDENHLWPVLAELLEKRFVPQELYMVSPPEMVSDPNYVGPRCGLRLVGGSWKFAYFLPYAQP